MKKKICFIIPYFGNFKNYFQLFLNSCRLNSDINWLIITDNKDEYDYPKNVKRIELGFNDLRKRSKRNLILIFHYLNHINFVILK